MKEERTFRMYGLCPYNLSPIQQGIQFGHAVVEYGLYFYDTDDYVKWANDDKTFIILNGGTTNTRIIQETLRPVGSLNQHLETLKEKKIPHATFYEPDLGDQLTAVVFLAEDRVWDKETYPDWIDAKNIMIPEKLGPKFWTYDEWVEWVGGETNVWLRDFLSQFKLA